MVKVYQLSENIEPGEPLPSGGWLRLADAARWAGVHTQTMSRWSKRGLVERKEEPSAGRYGMRVFISADSLMALERPLPGRPRK